MKSFLESKFRDVVCFFSHSFSTAEPRQMGFDTSVDLWENPPEASEAMKKAIATCKGKFSSKDPWDGNFEH